MLKRWSALSASEIDDLYAWPRTRLTRLNIVLDSAASLSGPDGTSRTLTNQHDREILRAIRKDADCVVVGAESVRREGWHRLPQGDFAVVTRSKNLPSGFPPEARAVSFDEALALPEHYQHVLCEGGRSLATQLSAHNFFDELCLTFADIQKTPVRVPSWLDQTDPWELAHHVADSTHQFTIWRRGTQ